MNRYPPPSNNEPTQQAYACRTERNISTKIQMCNNCRVETAHRSEPVQRPMSDAATVEICAECGFGAVVIPHVDTLDVHVKAAPQDLENGAVVINNPTSIAVNGQRVETDGPLTIRVGNVDVVRMA